MISSTEVYVSWYEVPEIDQNGVINLYEVLYLPLETFGDVIQANTMNSSRRQSSVTLSGLQEFVDYNISVRAYTRAGPGPYSDGVIITTLEDGKLMSINLTFKLSIPGIV